MKTENKLRAALELARAMMIANNLNLPHTMEIIDDALAPIEPIPEITIAGRYIIEMVSISGLYDRFRLFDEADFNAECNRPPSDHPTKRFEYNVCQDSTTFECVVNIKFNGSTYSQSFEIDEHHEHCIRLSDVNDDDMFRFILVCSNE